MKIKSIFFFFLGLLTFYTQAQKEQTAYVDKQGILRWKGSQKEIKAFGTNYTAPFAHDYRTAKKMGVDLKKAMANDVYHFARLHFDLFRMHVWDTEISDAEGNLLKNEHLDLFDYLFKLLKDRNIRAVLTPIAYWGNGWPEPDEDTPGFSHTYGKAKSLVLPKAIKAQENYLKQFLNHVNPYTGIAYKNDPNIIAFEVSNEPHHRGSATQITCFINKMVKSMRSTGTQKPIFYNVSHSVDKEKAYFEANIQGGTFQWYPTGLGFGKELQGNLLPNVDRYKIPFDSIIKKQHGAKIVYEFDAADVNKSYIYPAMARSFRTAGIQIATHFTYDPTFMAASNTEYNTHFSNLAYNPQKALALLIASKVFHEIPLNKDFGNYPKNTQFGNFSVNYKQDLAVYNAKEEFYYTNANKKTPKSPQNLKHIAGFGNSKVVRYEGSGAYFLDKLKNGVWRLEIMPDAAVVDNLFGKNNLSTARVVLRRKKWTMQLDITDLEQGFKITPLNEGNSFSPKVSGSSFSILPGTYLLSNKEISNFKDLTKLSQIGLKEFYAPKSNLNKTYVLHQPPETLTEAGDEQLSAQVISNKEIDSVQAWLQNGTTYKNLKLAKQTGDNFQVQLPKELLEPGFLNYKIIIYTSSGNFTFPGEVQAKPSDWDFNSAGEYSIRIVPKTAPLYLFTAEKDAKNILGEWKPNLKLLPKAKPGNAQYWVEIDSLFTPDIENKNAPAIYDYSFRVSVLDKLKGQRLALSQKDSLMIRAGTSSTSEKLQIALLLQNGAAFGKVIHLKKDKKLYKISLEELLPVKTVLLPRPYPSFLPYYFEPGQSASFDVERLESLQFSIGPGMDTSNVLKGHQLSIESVYLK